jgi:succinoglycan biosynthesis transport protein ExoP
MVGSKREAAMDEQEISLQDLWMTIWKRIWLIVGLVVVAAVAAYIASSFMTPIYEAETSFLIRSQASGLALPFDDSGTMGSSSNTVRNYVELLKSRTVMEKALGQLAIEPGSNDWPSLGEIRNAVSAQVIAQTDAVRVKVQLADKHFARDLANALVDQLIEHNRDMNQAATRTAREYLAKQLELSSVQLREAEERLLAVKAGSKITEPSAEAQALINRLVALQAQHAAAEVSVGEAMARAGKLREQLAGMSDTVVSSETVVEDSVVAGLRRRLADLEFDLASARERYTEQHPEVVKLVAEISEVKANLSSAVARVVGTQVSTPNPQRTEILRQIAQAEVEITAARAQQEGLARLIEQEQVRLAQLPEKELDLARVTRDLELAQEINACDGTDADLRHLPYRLRGDPGSAGQAQEASKHSHRRGTGGLHRRRGGVGPRVHRYFHEECGRNRKSTEYAHPRYYTTTRRRRGRAAPSSTHEARFFHGLGQSRKEA